MRKLPRRLLTVPAFLVLAAASLGLAPFWIPVLGIIDALRRRQLASLRCGAIFTCYFVGEAAGILACFAIWLRHGAWRGVAPERFIEANYRLQDWWVQTLFGCAEHVFGLRLEVEGDDALSGTPLLLFSRHASIVDTTLPGALLAAPHGVRLRYVVKRELLWDPCLDIVGNRTPNRYVDRDPDDSEAEVEAVGRLAAGISDGDGVVIFPEGTRFTPARRDRVIARLRDRGLEAAAQRAERLRCVLPPRPGGPLALIANAPDADVVFCAHSGFEASARLADLWAGRLIHARIRIRFWRVPAAEIPQDPEAQRQWLLGEWEAVDRWVAEAE